MDGGSLGSSIWKLDGHINVEPLHAEILENPDLWNLRPLRTSTYDESPHRQTDDIWVRFKAWIDVLNDPAACCDQHTSVYYPESVLIPSVFPIVERLTAMTDATELGGILITRVPAGKRIARHVDKGWHAEHYRKIAVQIRGNQRQAFCFDDAELRADTGEIYEFINQRPHWVLNDSNEDRITLIVCLK